MNDLAACRQFYAEELKAVAHLRSAALVRAFATVRREDFLGQGPWHVLISWEAGSSRYRTIEDCDPRHLYHNVLVAIDAARGLNNGHPSALASWFEQLDLCAGDHVVHVGCGTGYYTAILAEVVGPDGRVTAYEIDPDLAGRAQSNLCHWSSVEVIAGNGAEHRGAADAIFVNAGTTHLSESWLHSLNPAGRLLVPMTASSDPSGVGAGRILKVIRDSNGFTAAFVSEVGIFPCVGQRDPKMNAALTRAFEGISWKSVRSVRLDPHEPTSTCWLHGEGACVSAGVPSRGARVVT
jgi:protein-L-isoaspartate(D-aspartate) O-methyltransferase